MDNFVFFRKEVQFIFDKYAHQNVRSLKKPDAINLLKNEFNLNDAEATCMFDTFDKDQNEIMSIWEFQQFYETVGNGYVTECLITWKHSMTWIGFRNILYIYVHEYNSECVVLNLKSS